MAIAPTGLPHWDMTDIYPSLDSLEFKQGFAAVLKAIDDLAGLFDERLVGREEPASLDAPTVLAFNDIVNRLNEVLDQVQTVNAYIHSFVATDSRDNLAQARASELEQHSVRLSQLRTRLAAWIGTLDIDALVEQSEVAREHAFFLEKSKIRASHLMSPPEEALAAELSLSSGTAWSKLHSNLTSQIVLPVEIEGGTQVVPMSVVRGMAYDPDREVRRRAYVAELAAWERNAVPLAAAINSIKGEVNTLSMRRGWHSALDAAIFDANIDRQTLDAMMQAAHESFPDFRRYLRAKARALGVDVLAWYDIFAPTGSENRVWEYPEATAFIDEQFGTYSDKLRGLAGRAFSNNWVDAEPRDGKRDGAFCMSVRDGESRVLTNFKPAYGGMSTLAHELGHAYHNLVKASHTYLQKSTPMTLAETASIFCETIVRQAALERAGEQEQLSILEASLQDSCQVVVDITSRFMFESHLFARRLERELSVDELNNLMLESQRATYGEGLDENRLHPYMWAVKQHYYSSGLSFYNFPYMFGLLFGLGLYARYRKDPAGFRAGYDDLLSSTGMADAPSLAARFGIDVRTPGFWRSSLDVIREDINRFERLVG